MKIIPHLFLIAAVVAGSATPGRADSVRAPTPASAQAPPPHSAIDNEQPRPPPPDRHPGYHRHLLMVDASALALVLLAAPFDSPELAFVGLATYAAGAAVVHGAAHERTASIWGSSVLMRTLFPIAGGMLGYYIGRSDCSREFICGAHEAGLGILTGAVSAMVIDYSVLASEHGDDTVRKPRALTTANVVPAPVRGGMTLNFGGRF